MSANDALHIAVLAGDGIGPEVMAPALEVLRKIETTSSLKFRFTDAPAGANNYRETGKSMPDSTVRLCDEADAILLGACGLPAVRYPDNTEIMPQVELRFHFDLYAGVRPARLIPGVPSPIVGADKRGIDLIVIRESTEGLFASMGKGVVTHDDARETLVITRKTSERLFEFSFRFAERRKSRGKPGALTCVDKANVFKAFAFFREMFDQAAARHPEVKADRHDPVRRDDAGLARRKARTRGRRGAKPAHRARGRQGLCRRHQADGVRRQQRHRGHREGGAGGVVVSRAPDAAQRAALAERCTAEPGP